MSQAGSERETAETRPRDELIQVVAELRAELQSIRERELRRESRLVTFDQQVAQMEASLEKEVERLRTTGSAVDLITEHLRIAVRELLGEREHMAGELDDLRASHHRARRPRPPAGARAARPGEQPAGGAARAVSSDRSPTSSSSSASRSCAAQLPISQP